jgi:hypothetical protein
VLHHEVEGAGCSWSSRDAVWVMRIEQNLGPHIEQNFASL